MAGSSQNAERKQLVEMLGLYFEQQKMVPPVASRILATLILNGTRGTTFEELVRELAASKGTISTSLNTLVAQQRVIYFTKPGDRRRYHCMAPGYITRKIRSLLDQWRLEAELHGRILAYKKAVNRTGGGEPISTHVQEDAVEFLGEAMALLTRMAEKYRARENQYLLHKR
ncbi:MAG: MarR family transcriptional regulator [Flavobacteriales bacterium]|nr:MarR family transcriptional regulator [Flavobacteriales bacterium]MEB2340544.1 helix-turn-helix domain-containing protein [Flavobacteriia bacterium]